MCWIKPILFILLQMISLVVLLTAANLCEFWRASLRTSLPLVWVEMQSKYVQRYKNYYVKLYKLDIAKPALNIRYWVRKIFKETIRNNLLGRSLGPPNDGLDIINGSRLFQDRLWGAANMTEQRRTSPEYQNRQRIRKAMNVKFGDKKLKPREVCLQSNEASIARKWVVTFQGTSSKWDQERQCKMKPNELSLHKAHHVYLTRNWKEMQNERGLQFTARNTAVWLLIGPKTISIVNELNTCPSLSVPVVWRYRSRLGVESTWSLKVHALRILVINYQLKEEIDTLDVNYIFVLLYSLLWLTAAQTKSRALTRKRQETRHLTPLDLKPKF